MTKIDYRRVIKERAKELLEKGRFQSKAFIRDRIRFLRLLKTGKCSSQLQAGELMGLSPRSSQRLWQQYQQGGLKALLTYPFQGTNARLSKEQTAQLISKLAEDNIQLLHEAK